MSLIRLELNRFGTIELSFVNARTLRRVLQTVIANGGPKDRKAYVQHDGDIRELKARLSVKTRTDLQAGWPVRILIDDREAAHYYGYDAHTAFEGP